ENPQYVPSHADRGPDFPRAGCSGHHYDPQRSSSVDEGRHRARRHSGPLMPKDPIIAIRDCLSEIAILHDLAGRMTLATLRTDPVARRAAAYSIQTISEAVRRIPDAWLADYPSEPWAQIRAIGNRIRHEYYRLDDAILWQIMTVDAASLKTVMETMLARHADD